MNDSKMRKTAPIISKYQNIKISKYQNIKISKYRPEFDTIRQNLAIFSPFRKQSNELRTYPSIATITKLCKL